MLKDKDIREPLFDFLEDRHSKIRIIEEKTMGKSRADVIMVLENEVGRHRNQKRCRHVCPPRPPGKRLRPVF